MLLAFIFIHMESWENVKIIGDFTIILIHKHHILLWLINVVYKLESARLELPWWRHQMETFSGLLAFCEGNLPVTSGFPSQRPDTRSFDVFFDLRLDIRLSKQSRLWFQTPSRSLWRHCNDKAQSLCLFDVSVFFVCFFSESPNFSSPDKYERHLYLVATSTAKYGCDSIELICVIL